MTGHSFTANVAALAQQARRDMRRGPPAGGHGADPVAVAEVLNYALATQIVCWSRYAALTMPEPGRDSGEPDSAGMPVPDEIAGRAQEGLSHAARIAGRISELGGDPDLDPASLTGRIRPGTIPPGDDLTGMLREDLAAERIVIATYRDIVCWLGDSDVYSRRMIESMLEEEQKHADDILDLLGALAGRS